MVQGKWEKEVPQISSFFKNMNASEICIVEDSLVDSRNRDIGAYEVLVALYTILFKSTPIYLLDLSRECVEHIKDFSWNFGSFLKFIV